MAMHLQRDKDLKELAALSAAGKRVIFTNGCFDILHVGHLRYLTRAKALGEILVIGLNSDASVRRLKGDSRPVCSELERQELLHALRPVDYVIIFEEDTPLTLIKTIRPAVLTKGGDWSVDQIVGGDFVKSYGGDVISLPFVEGQSTTGIIERILGGAVKKN